MAKAQQFQNVAADALTLVDDGANIADAVVALCVHAGIAASGAICAAKLGRYAKGLDHQDAVRLLATVDRSAAKYLSTLLGMKTKAGYGYQPVSGADITKAARAMDALVDLAARSPNQEAIRVSNAVRTYNRAHCDPRRGVRTVG